MHSDDPETRRTPISRSIPDLLSDLIRDLSALFRTESRLVKAEISEALGRMATGAELIGAGSIVLLVSLVVLAQALVIALSNIMGPGWAALAVGGALAVIGAVMVARGKSDLSANTLVPERTLGQTSRDAELARSQMSSDQTRKESVK
ncbi:phage holin family protein [Pararhizobium haloflavum]|uniref:phage holin family protein n=1 Tax=Pararhizobium haloflavum TaxID=2037914 RepID=UPI000C1A5FA4|nr:phage holin family protein [Pararhizobium haloflavum]